MNSEQWKIRILCAPFSEIICCRVLKFYSCQCIWSDNKLMITFIIRSSCISVGRPMEPEFLPSPIKNDGIDSYKCPICGFTSMYCGSVKRHIASHSSKRRFHCNLCPKAFKRKAYLTQHMYLHFPDKSKASHSKT